MRFFVILYLVMSIQSAHALFGSDYPSDPVAVFDMGVSQLEKRKYKKAVKTFEHFLSKHSNHDLFPKVKVKYGDALYGNENFMKALRVYERSHLESPHNEDGAHTLFRMGECNLKFISKDKGQKHIPYAIAAFERFLTLYPEHIKVEEAKKNILVIKKVEAEYQIEVGNYYFRHKDYCAAFSHFEKVLKLKDYGTYKTVDSYIAKCQQKELCLDELASCEFELREVNSRMK